MACFLSLLEAPGYISYYLQNTPTPKPMLTFQRSTGFKPVPECIAPTLSSLCSVSVSLSESEYVTYCGLIQLSEISTCQSCHTASIRGGLNIFLAGVFLYTGRHMLLCLNKGHSLQCTGNAQMLRNTALENAFRKKWIEKELNFNCNSCCI